MMSEEVVSAYYRQNHETPRGFGYYFLLMAFSMLVLARVSFARDVPSDACVQRMQI